MRNSWILLLSVPLLYLLGNRPDHTLVVVGQLGESSVQALRYEEIEFQHETGLTKISSKDPEALLRALSRADQGLASAKRVVWNNLRNQHVTKSIMGEPYRRQFSQFRPDGTFRGVVEDPGDYNWVYDPSHPDAMRDGPKAGYVAKPAINPAEEHATLAEIASQRKVLQDLIRQISPDAVFSSVAPYEPWNPVEMEYTGPHIDQLLSMNLDPLDPGLPFSASWGVEQTDAISSGQASVACALNWLSGQSTYTVASIESKYGFGLMNALKAESLSLNVDWRDAGNFSNEIWPEIEQTLQLHRPVLLAFAGAAPDERSGKIVVLIGSDGDTLRYFDPSNGEIVKIHRQALIDAPSHPDGNFVFLPSKLPEF